MTDLPVANWKEYALWLLRRRQRFEVVEDSMLPTLKPGDVVLAKPLSGPSCDEISLDDIVVARHPVQSDLLLVKRVAEMFHDGGCYLLSDNLAKPTVHDSRSFGIVSATQVVARVTSRLVP